MTERAKIGMNIPSPGLQPIPPERILASHCRKVAEMFDGVQPGDPVKVDQLLVLSLIKEWAEKYYASISAE